jgi:hypothetical protein
MEVRFKLEGTLRYREPTGAHDRKGRPNRGRDSSGQRICGPSTAPRDAGSGAFLSVKLLRPRDCTSKS